MLLSAATRLQYVSAKLGPEFMEPPPWTLDDVFPDTSSTTPVIFILSTGARSAGGDARQPPQAQEGSRSLAAALSAAASLRVWARRSNRPI